MRLRLRHIILLVMPALLAAGCRRLPSGVLPHDRMTPLMADLYRGESTVEFNGAVYSTDSMKKVVKQSIFEAHGVTQEQFDRSLDWYGHHIEDFVKVCDDAIHLLESQLESIPADAVTGSLQVAGDSAMIWMLPTYYRITDKMPSRFISFSVDKDDEWKPGDIYNLAVKIGNTRSDVVTMMGVDYADGFTEYLSSASNNPGRHDISLRLDSTRTAERVYGNIAFNPAPGEVIYLDSVSLMRTRVNPSLYFRRVNQHLVDMNE